jgi:hypothetical protein
MRSARPAGRGFFPLDEELELLPGKLTPREHERLVRLSGWLAFERAAELVEEFLGIAVDKSMAQRYTETAGAIYVQMQEEEVVRLEQEMPKAAAGAEKMQISADGAMVPLLHGVWAEVRTLVIGEVEASQAEQGEGEVHVGQSHLICLQNCQILGKEHNLEQFLLKLIQFFNFSALKPSNLLRLSV